MPVERGSRLGPYEISPIPPAPSIEMIPSRTTKCFSWRGTGSATRSGRRTVERYTWTCFVRGSSKWSRNVSLVPNGRNDDVSADGSRFIMNTVGAHPSPTIVVVRNWKQRLVR